MPSRLLLLAVVVLSVTCGDPDPGGGDAALPDLAVQRELVDVLAAFGDGDVRIVSEHADFPLELFTPYFVPGPVLASDGDRRVLRAHADSAFETEVGPLPSRARLLARTFVYSPLRNDPERVDPVPLDFRILVDGEVQQVLSSAYVREPTDHAYDQLLRDLEIDLAPWVGQTVTLRFETVRDEPVPPEVTAPEPGWWSLKIVGDVSVARQRASAARPNLLVLCVDTLAARRTSLHGHERDTTPRLRELASRGTTFTQASSPSSWTLPSTASLLSGLPPNTHGVLGDGREYLMDALATWPELLRDEGLDGLAVVGNALVVQASNFDQGFGRFEHDPGEHGDDVDAERLNAHLFRWLDAQPPGARWFAYVHSMDPHAPYGAPRDRDRFTDDYVERRSFAGHLPGKHQRGELEPPLAPDEQQHIADLYDGEVAYADAMLGELLDGLGARGMLDDTVVVFTADHGEELFEHGGLGHGYDLSEVMLHVPLVLAGPGVPAGEVVETPVTTTAVHATLLRLAGLAPLPGTARPLLPLRDLRQRAEPVYALTRTRLFGPPRTLVSARDAEGRKLRLELDEADGSVRVRTTAQLGEDPLELRATEVAELTGAFAELEQQAMRWFQESAEARPAQARPEVDNAAAILQIGYGGHDGESDG